MQPIVSPLKTADVARPIPKGLERLGIVGRVLWLCFRPSWRFAYFQSVKRQVEERGSIPDSVWGTPRRLAVAREVEDILAVACWQERLSFHPDDPWRVIGEWESGDLSELDALWRIGDRFGCDLQTKAFAKQIVEGLTFGEMVSFLEEHGSRVADMPHPQRESPQSVSMPDGLGE